MLGLTEPGMMEGNFPRTVPVIEAGLTFVLVFASRWAISLFSRRHEFRRMLPLQTLKPTGARGYGKEVSTYGILGGPLGLYMLWSKLTFGTASPVSGQIKRWWGSFTSRVYGGAARSPLSFFGIDPESDFNAWAPITNLVGK